MILEIPSTLSNGALITDPAELSRVAWPRYALCPYQVQVARAIFSP